MAMLSHFKIGQAAKIPTVKYSLRGHFSSGQSKLIVPIDIAFLKQHLLTYRENKVERRHHEDLGVTDAELREFSSLLSIDVNAASFERQYEEVIKHLQAEHNCSQFAAEYFYYNSSLALIRELSIQQDAANRTISKRAFLKRVDSSSVLFNEWFVQKKGKKAHLTALRREYFADLNHSPFERFFLVEVDPKAFVRVDLKQMLHTLSRKWAKTSRRDGESSFCPYIYFHGLPVDELVALKKELTMEEFGFIDGYDFHGADFNVKSIARRATHDNGIKCKVLNSTADLATTLGNVTKTREVYQFHFAESYFDPANDAIKHVMIQVENLKDIMEII
jgi:hypothetical protein